MSATCPPETNGHVNIGAVAGNASLTFYGHGHNGCQPILLVLLDEASVGRLRRELDEAVETLAANARPRQVRLDGVTWRVDCPECGTRLPGRWIHQAGALATAYQHVENRHPQEKS